jgi:hypothetical protein
MPDPQLLTISHYDRRRPPPSVGGENALGTRGLNGRLRVELAWGRGALPLQLRSANTRRFRGRPGGDLTRGHHGRAFEVRDAMIRASPHAARGAPRKPSVQRRSNRVEATIPRACARRPPAGSQAILISPRNSCLHGPLNPVGDPAPVSPLLDARAPTKRPGAPVRRAVAFPTLFQRPSAGR